MLLYYSLFKIIWFICGKNVKGISQKLINNRFDMMDKSKQVRIDNR